MQPAEAVLVHHVHPAKIGADITASVVSDVLLWKHKPRIAVAVRVLLPAAGSPRCWGLPTSARWPGPGQVSTYSTTCRPRLRRYGWPAMP